MQIFIVSATGRHFTIECDSTTTIAKIKQHLHDNAGLPSEFARLIFAGKQLENHRTLDDYNIQKESTIHLSITMRGGGGGDFMGPNLEKWKSASSTIPGDGEFTATGAAHRTWI